MKCPECNAWATVLETRERSDGTIYRRYQCANNHRFSTRETVLPESVKTARAAPSETTAKISRS